MNLPNHYKILGVAPSATHEEIRAAYLAIAKANHPDTGSGAVDTLKAASEAYRILKTPILRNLFDKQRQMLLQPCQICGGTGTVGVFKKMVQVSTKKCLACDGTGEEELQPEED